MAVGRVSLEEFKKLLHEGYKPYYQIMHCENQEEWDRKHIDEGMRSIQIGILEVDQYKVTLEMCVEKCCIAITVEKEGELLGRKIMFSRLKGEVCVDLRCLVDDLVEDPTKCWCMGEDEAYKVAQEVEEHLNFISSMPKLDIIPAKMSEEDKRMIREEFGKADLLRYLEAVCTVKPATASSIARKLKVSKRTVIERMKFLKECGLVESKERHKGYRPTRIAHQII